jgi:putative oxidoreductase
MKSGRGFGEDAGLLIGRVMLAVLYLPFGLEKAANWGNTVTMMRSLHAPAPFLATIIAVFCETFIPLLIIIGFQTRLLSVVMILYTAGATFLAHRFWQVPSAEFMEAEINFFKNIAIMGGFLLLAVSGPGRFSIDKD